MEQQIADILKQYGWIGFLIIVMLFLLTNSSSTTLFIKLIEHFSKPKDASLTKEYNKFSLLKLDRSSNTGNKVFATISNVLVLGFFWYAYAVARINNLGTTTVVLAYIGILFPTWFICDLWIKQKSIFVLEIDGDPDDLFRTYQMMLFDMNVFIRSFDAQSKELTAYRNGNELTIKIEHPVDSRNKVTIRSSRDFMGTFFYSREYQKIILNLVNNMCYPAKH